jgi:6-phosphogluconate dehydrogenase
MKTIGFVGLGKMGAQIVEKIISSGTSVVIFDTNASAIPPLVARGAVAATSEADLVSKLGEHPYLWLMIPSQFVDTTIDTYLALLPKGSTIIDGGNSDFRKTLTRAEKLRKNGMNFIDIGTSGGVLGAANGFSLMVGSTEEEYATLTPILHALSLPRGGHERMGPVGYGHYVKMVHNGIEYAMMQSLAEGYQVLREGALPNVPLERVAHIWQKGSIINSTLNALTEEIFKENVNLDGIDGYVDASGEGAWTQEVARAAHIPTPALDVAIQVRNDSHTGKINYATKLLAAMRNKFGGHMINKK